MTFEEWGKKRPVDMSDDGLLMYADWKASRGKLLTTMKMLEGATESFLAAIRRTIQEVKRGTG